jgi:hypothetical protein
MIRLFLNLAFVKTELVFFEYKKIKVLLETKSEIKAALEGFVIYFENTFLCLRKNDVRILCRVINMNFGVFLKTLVN